MDELMRRANNGDAEAEAELARRYANNEDFESSVQWNLRAASHGSSAAMLALWSQYSNGNGVQANQTEANKWLIKSADAGCGAAMFSLAGKYRDGSDGFQQNPNLAFKYTERMCNAEGWSSCGRFETAECYLKGIGVAKDVNKAYNMFLELANEGYGDAQFKMAYMYGSGIEFESNPEQAVYWANQAVNSTKTAGVSDVEKVHQLANKILQMEYSNQENNSNENSGGCYIATAVYGSYDCPQVWVLRRFRDYKLAKTWYGRAFIKIYYAISPTLVKWFGKSSWFINLWKPKLDDMVRTLKDDGFDDTPYRDK